MSEQKGPPVRAYVRLPAPEGVESTASAWVTLRPGDDGYEEWARWNKTAVPSQKTLTPEQRKDLAGRVKGRLARMRRGRGGTEESE